MKKTSTQTPSYFPESGDEERRSRARFDETSLLGGEGVADDEDVAAEDDGAMGGGDPVPRARGSRRKKFLIAGGGILLATLATTVLLRSGDGPEETVPGVPTAGGREGMDTIAVAGGSRAAASSQRRIAAKPGTLEDDALGITGTDRSTQLGGLPRVQENFLDPDQLRMQEAADRARVSDSIKRAQDAMRRQGPRGAAGVEPGFLDPNDPIVMASGQSPTGTPGQVPGGGSGVGAGAGAPDAATGGTGAGQPGMGQTGAGTAGGYVIGADGRPVQQVPLNGAGLSPAEVARQARLDSLRERARADSARAQAEAKRRKEEEQRLRQQATLIASNNDVLKTATEGGGGLSRFGVQGAMAPIVAGGGARMGGSGPGTGATGAPVARVGTPVDARMAAAMGAPGQAAGGAGGVSAMGFDVTPGSQVSAEVTNEFIGDMQGAGPVAVRLTTPLKLRNGRVLLPAGTVGWGTASAASVQAGRRVGLTMSVNQWVLPDKTVLRGQPVGRGADPNTYALSVPAQADWRFVSRAARGAASTAVELALTSQTQNRRRSVFEQPTPYEIAMNRGAQRVSNLLTGGIGDENSLQPTVKLPRGTPVLIIFGIQ